MRLQHQPVLDSRMVCCSILGNSCHIYAVNCNPCTCCTMDVSPRWHLLFGFCTLLKCQLWYLTVIETIPFSDSVKSIGYKYWLFWFSWSYASVKYWNVPPCCRCIALYVDPNNIVVWDNHQGVGPADCSNFNLIVNE